MRGFIKNKIGNFYGTNNLLTDRKSDGTRDKRASGGLTKCNRFGLIIWLLLGASYGYSLSNLCIICIGIVLRSRRGFLNTKINGDKLKKQNDADDWKRLDTAQDLIRMFLIKDEKYDCGFV